MKRGFACGVFDLFHAGHVLMLQECRENCDYLIVALNTATNLGPDKNQPIYSIEQRVIILEACRYVDEVITYSTEDELTELLASLNLGIRFLGDDYRIKPITAPHLDIPLYFVNRDHGWSSSKIREKIDR
ncbi:MAG: adenylyltransferase/cytidyltransferase family protein [Salibacteraceae bacterium]